MIGRAGACYRLHKAQRLGIDAKAILGGRANPALGVHGAAEVHVQVCSLGHVHQKASQGQRSLLLGRIKRSCSASLVWVSNFAGGSARLGKGSDRKSGSYQGRGEQTHASLTRSYGMNPSVM